MGVKFWIENGQIVSGSEDSEEYKAYKKHVKELRHALNALALDTIAVLQTYAIVWEDVNNNEPDAETSIEFFDGYKKKVRATFFFDAEPVEKFEIELSIENRFDINEERVQDFLFGIREFFRDHKKELDEKAERERWGE